MCNMTSTRRDALRLAGTSLLGVATVGTATAASLSVTTDWADPTGDYSFALGGTLESLGDTATADCYFEYRPEGASTWSTTPRQTRETTGGFSDEVTGVNARTTYEYRAVVVAGDGSETAWGATDTFYVAGAAPTVQTDTATEIDTTAATLNGTLTDTGDALSVDVYFEYRQPGDTWQRTERVSRTDTGSFSARVTGLERDAGYEFLAIAEGDNGRTDWGDYRKFATDSTLAAVTDPATNVDETAVTLDGEVTDLGGADSVDVHFTYFETGSSVGYRTATQTLTAPGPVSARVTDLARDTEYGFELRAAASDGDTTGGGLRYVTTDTRFALTTTGATGVEPTQATLNATVDDLGDAASATVTFEYRPVGAADWTTADSVTVSTVGDVATTATGLQDDTEYEYRTTATASDGDTAAGGTATFTTPLANHPPTIGRLTASDTSSPNPHVDLYVEWGVADADANLAEVTVTIRDGRDDVVYANTTAVSGGQASGSEDPKRIKKGAGQAYTVTLHVRDADGATTSEQRVVRT